MLPHPDYFHMFMAKQREAELVEKARLARLLAEIKADKPGVKARFFSNSGALLIRIGQKLKGRYEPEPPIARQQPFFEGVHRD